MSKSPSSSTLHAHLMNLRGNTLLILQKDGKVFEGLLQRIEVTSGQGYSLSLLYVQQQHDSRLAEILLPQKINNVLTSPLPFEPQMTIQSEDIVMFRVVGDAPVSTRSFALDGQIKSFHSQPHRGGVERELTKWGVSSKSGQNGKINGNNNVDDDDDDDDDGWLLEAPAASASSRSSSSHFNQFEVEVNRRTLVQHDAFNPNVYRPEIDTSHPDYALQLAEAERLAALQDPSLDNNIIVMRERNSIENTTGEDDDALYSTVRASNRVTTTAGDIKPGAARQSTEPFVPAYKRRQKVNDTRVTSPTMSTSTSSSSSTEGVVSPARPTSVPEKEKPESSPSQEHSQQQHGSTPVPAPQSTTPASESSAAATATATPTASSTQTDEKREPQPQEEKKTTLNVNAPAFQLKPTAAAFIPPSRLAAAAAVPAPMATSTHGGRPPHPSVVHHHQPQEGYGYNAYPSSSPSPQHHPYPHPHPHHPPHHRPGPGMPAYQYDHQYVEHQPPFRQHPAMGGQPDVYDGPSTGSGPGRPLQQQHDHQHYRSGPPPPQWHDGSGGWNGDHARPPSHHHHHKQPPHHQQQPPHHQQQQQHQRYNAQPKRYQGYNSPSIPPPPPPNA